MARGTGIQVERIGFAGDCARLSGPVAMSEHAHVEIELNLALDGRLQYLFAGRAVEFPEARWLAYWAALPHRGLRVDGVCRLFWFTVPVATFIAWDEDSGLAQRLLRGEMVIEPTARPGVAEAADATLRALRGDQRHRRLAELEIEAIARRLAIDGRALAPAIGTPRPRRREATRRDAAEPVELMATWLAERYRDDGLDVAACAEAAGLHPNYAMTLFRRATGATIWQYLTRLRLAHAQRLLLTSEREVLDIALDAGFGSQARFYVAFKKAFGTTPAAFRRGKRTAESG
jgi:AraC-like DNA-binding protein